jgi:hypothetical protein
MGGIFKIVFVLLAVCVVLSVLRAIRINRGR